MILSPLWSVECIRVITEVYWMDGVHLGPFKLRFADVLVGGAAAEDSDNNVGNTLDKLDSKGFLFFCSRKTAIRVRW